MKANIVLHCFVGLAGMHLLLTSMGGMFRPAVLYLATVVTLAGAMVLHVGVGARVSLIYTSTTSGMRPGLVSSSGACRFIM